MKTKQIMIVGVCAALMLSSASLAADDAAASFAQGKTLLAKADFEGALKGYAAAAKAAPDNEEYRTEFSILRRVIKMRQQLTVEKNAEKWESSAKALRQYYHMNGIYSEALPIDQELYKKHKDADTAAMLAETELALNHNAEAADLLGEFNKNGKTPQTEVLQGVALARLSKTDEAKAMMTALKVPDDADPGLLFDVARLHSLLGDAEAAVGLLVKVFEQTPPSRHTFVKDYTSKHPDLTATVKLASYEKALKTESKVKESGCSGGSSCGSCSSKSSCSSSKSCSDKSSCKDKESCKDDHKDKEAAAEKKE